MTELTLSSQGKQKERDTKWKGKKDGEEDRQKARKKGARKGKRERDKGDKGL